MQPNAPNLTPVTQPNYDFIVNPSKPPAKAPFSGFGSLPIKIAFIGGGLILLMIIFVVIKSFTGGTSNSASMITVVQEQQALIHITTASTKQAGTNVKTQNSSATIQATVTSDQTQLLAYFKTNGLKITTATENLKVSTTVDAQLATAASAGTYDSTYQTVIQTALTNYSNALKIAYNQTKGPKGRALLSTDFDSTQLLIKQISN